MAIVNVPETLVNLHPSEGLAAIIPRSPSLNLSLVSSDYIFMGSSYSSNQTYFQTVRPIPPSISLQTDYGKESLVVPL